ncbi:hypothetical protein GBA52_010471 [Prunus armeniaca]|nr:hypothetical protein GBA52_010471 [Prunus armeniaca]
MAFKLQMQEAITASLALKTLVVGLRFEFSQLERTTPFWTSPPPRSCSSSRMSND